MEKLTRNQAAVLGVMLLLAGTFVFRDPQPPMWASCLVMVAVLLGTARLAVGQLRWIWYASMGLSTLGLLLCAVEVALPIDSI